MPEGCAPPCGPGLRCNANRICVPLPCTIDEQCGNGKICKNGICIPDGCNPPCGPGLRCNANKICVPLPCTMDEQCGGGLFANLCYRGNIYCKMSKNADWRGKTKPIMAQLPFLLVPTSPRLTEFFLLHFYTISIFPCHKVIIDKFPFLPIIIGRRH